MEALILITLAFIIYFAPSIIAVVREHHQAAAIFLFNLFLGWTLLGWVIALVWSATATNPSTVVPKFKTCPECAEKVQAAAKVCRYCSFEFVPKVFRKSDSSSGLKASTESQSEKFRHAEKQDKKGAAADAPDTSSKFQPVKDERIVEPPKKQVDASRHSTSTTGIVTALLVVGFVGTLVWFMSRSPTERVEQVGQSSSGSSETTVENDLLQDKGLVRKIQIKLTSLGYDPGPVDGVMGSKTKTAIEKFQKTYETLADGRPSHILLSQLRIWSATRGGFDPSATGEPPVAQTSIDVGKTSKPTAASHANPADLRQAKRFLSKLPSACSNSYFTTSSDGTVTIRIKCAGNNTAMDGVVAIKDGIVTEIR